MEDVEGGSKVHKRFAQKFHHLPSSGGSDSEAIEPKLAKAQHYGHGGYYAYYENHRCKLPLALVALALVYFAGYFNGASFRSLNANVVSDGAVDEELDALGLNKLHQEALNLDTIGHMQGFSEAYPTYQLNEADQHPSVNEPDDEESSMDSDDEDDDSKEALGNEDSAQEEEEEVVEITSDLSEQELFEDYNQYISAPFVSVPDVKAKYDLPYKLPKRNLWWALKAYESQYKLSPIRNYVPRVKRNIQLTLDEFHKRFRRPAQPVLFNFENLRSLGFATQNYTISQLKKMFPFDESRSSEIVQQQFVANGVRKDDEELDLGPGLVAIERDEELAKKGKLRSFPRNLKVKQDAISKLKVEKPPLVKDMEQFQLPTVWMGTSSSDTRFHHDCCDNFVMMISGTKRFTLSPTSDWRVLNPQCIGKNKALCWANVNNPNNDAALSVKEKNVMRYVHKMVVDVGPGDILYMPAGWFHHIQNLGPTVMVNWWTKSSETCALTKARANKNY